MSRVIHYSGVTHKGNPTVFKTRSGGRRTIDHVFAGDHQAIPYGVRLVFYVLATVILVEGITYSVLHTGAQDLFVENGLLEWLQISLLLLCVFLLQAVAPRFSEVKKGTYLLSFFPLLACIRELDHILDTFIFDGAWQLMVFGLTLYMVYYSVTSWPEIKYQTFRILALPSTGLFFAGFLTVMVFSRLFGQQSFWKIALQEDYVRIAGRIAEEGCEIFGYLLLVFGCIELLIFALSCSKKTIR